MTSNALKGVAELIARADSLLKQDTYHRPERSHVYLTYYAVNPLRGIVVNYYGEIPLGVAENSTTIIHGHKEGELCYAGYYCHEYGYRPGPETHPTFRRLFYQQFPSYRV